MYNCNSLSIQNNIHMNATICPYLKSASPLESAETINFPTLIFSLAPVVAADSLKYDFSIHFQRILHSSTVKKKSH